MEVWIVESGEYEQRGIVLVAASREAAFEAVKALYGPPYRVKWSIAPEDKYDAEALIGEFEQVTGYSVGHTARFDATPYDVKDA